LPETEELDLADPDQKNQTLVGFHFLARHGLDPHQPAGHQAIIAGLSKLEQSKNLSKIPQPMLTQENEEPLSNL
jgi:hypothetical protein